jgi:3-oxoacyl-[acyl-carrier protein] reductase
MSARELEGRVSLVTGASRGIGRAIAVELSRRGAHLLLAARDATALEATAALCREAGGKADTVVLDLAEAASVKAGMDAALQKSGGRLDHLINNAGVTGDGLLLRMKRADWDRVIATNLTGAFETTRLALPVMLKARSGRIVNISSIVALMGNPGQANYCAAKAGVIGMTKSLAREVASRSITVNAIAPGLIDTDMTRDLPEAARTKMTESIPLQRLGTAEDIAQAAAFLVGPGAAYITGEVLNVSGGLYM